MNQRGRVVQVPMSGRPDRVYTVSELTESIKRTLEERLGAVMVQGEVSELTRHASGHIYFSLKDTRAQIRIALFASKVTATIREVLQVGMTVRVEGQLTVYAVRGDLQVIAARVEPVGYGALQAQFEALKRKLQLEGLFADERKRALPRYPTRIGIVTSASGAALHDIVRVLRIRAPYASITVADVRVQGDGAAREIAMALARMNAWGGVDVIVVGRGGGSPQDLWAFNEEPVVRAIVASRIPVVSAVGHEVDITLADLAADVRAATPTQAGSLVVKDHEDIRRTLRDLTRHAHERILRELRQAGTNLRGLENHYALKHPERRIQDGRQTVDQIDERLSRAVAGGVVTRTRKTELLTERLRSHAPSRSFARAHDRIDAARKRAEQALRSRLGRSLERVASQTRLLGSFDHHQVLERGYALVWNEGGKRLLKRGAGLAASDSIEVQFFDARAAAKVTQVVREKETS
jgi:exodeoxyribonuclease VII large subunit